MTRSTATPATSTGRILALDLLRGIAALFVFFHHAVVWGGASFGPFTELARGGRIGVLIFFALSGFVIGRRVLPGVNLRQYVLGRGIRVLPAYYVALAAMVALSLVFGNGHPPFLIAYLLVLGGHTADGSPFFSQAWTLTVEMEFYLLVPFIVGLRGSWLLLIAGVTAVLAVAPAQLGILDFGWAFIPGIALARMELRRPDLYQRLTSRPVALAGVLLTAATMLLNPDPLVGIVGVPATFLLIAGFAGRTLPASLHGVARWAGDLSYPFYLWHQYPVALFGSFVGFIVALLGSIASVVLVETPARHWFATWIRCRPEPLLTAAAA